MAHQPPPFSGPPRPMVPGPMPFSGPPGYPSGVPPPGFPYIPGMPPPRPFPGVPPGVLLGPGPPMLRPPAQAAPPYILPRPTGPPSTAVSRPGLPPAKETTVWVGKISATVDDSLIRSLLEACGTIKSWKPMKDPDSGKSKGFGFCEFEDAEGVLRAIRLLNHLPLDGQEILLKCNTATQKYVDDYAARKEAEAMQKRVRKSAEAALTEKIAKDSSASTADGEQLAEQDKEAQPAVEEDAGDDDDAFDSRVLELIMGLISQQEGKTMQKASRSAEAATTQLLSELPGPPPGRPSHGKALEREERRAEQEFEERRKRERQEADRERRRAEDRYAAAVRKLEHWERERRLEAEKEYEREKDTAKERLRSVRAEAELVSDTEEEAWRRPLYSASRRHEDRKRRRDKEETEDEADREAEAAAKAAAVASRTDPIPDDIADGLLTNGLRSPSSERHTTPKAHVDPNDPIYQAMIAAAKAKPSHSHGTPEFRATPPQASPSPLRSPAAQPGAAQPARAAVPPAKKAKVLAAFGADEDEDQPKRKLIPLQYSAEEIRAAQAPAAAAEDDEAAVPKSKEAMEKALKSLIRSIPSERAGIFAYDINWSAYDSGRSAMAAKILGWVKMKVQELMGEEEASMVEFVMGQLNEHVPPNKLHEDLGPVLDDEVDSFVIKLYRMVIFETQKHAQGLQEVA